MKRNRFKVYSTTVARHFRGRSLKYGVEEDRKSGNMPKNNMVVLFCF